MGRGREQQDGKDDCFWGGVGRAAGGDPTNFAHATNTSTPMPTPFLLATGRPALRGLLAMPRAAKSPARLGRHVVSVAICHKGELPPVLGAEAPESVQVCDGTVEEEEKGGRDRRDVVCIFCVCI